MNKKITSRDVAKAAGVSQSLVSLILNNVPDKKIKAETREHVISVAKQLNYTANVNARNMKNRRAGAIGLLSSWDAGSFVFPPIIKGVQAICSENDLGVVICTGKEDLLGNKDYINYFHQNRIDALIYISYVGVTREGVIDDLLKNGIPFVCIIGARDIPGISCVDVSFLESGYIAGKHLVERGYSRIGYILDDKGNNPIYAEKERLEGCRAAVEAGGKEFFIIDSLASVCGEEILLNIAEELLKKNSFDSFVACSHGCYIILKAAARLGIKVPETLGVISLDNEVYAPYLHPSLTTVDEPLFDIARSAMSLLLESLNGNEGCKKLEIAPRLSVRESTARA